MEQLRLAGQWFLTPEGRLIGAVVIFFLMWGIKNIPWVKRTLLKTDRAKLIASAFLSMTPAIVMLLDTSVPAKEAWMTAGSMLLSAMGVQGGLKALLGKAMKGTLSIGEVRKNE